MNPRHDDFNYGNNNGEHGKRDEGSSDDDEGKGGRRYEHKATYSRQQVS